MFCEEESRKDMAKTKQQSAASAANRREQARQGRSAAQPTSSRSKQLKRGKRNRQAQRNATWLFVGGILVLVVVVVGLFIFL